MEFTTLNNATLICKLESKNILTLDPWIIGSLYWNTWLPSKKATQKQIQEFIDSKYIYISHLHNDHWDLETLKLLDKNKNFILPDLPFVQNVIGKNLEKNGFLNINYLKTNEIYKLDKDISISIIPPLNYYGAETELYEKINNEFEIALDTGLIINDLKNQVSHLALCDNTPYSSRSAEIIKKILPKNFIIGSVWYPFNGAAQDYPLCYDNLSLQEKKAIVKSRFGKRNKCIIKLNELISSKILIPYSSDFELVGKRSSEFNKVNSNTLYRKNSSYELNKLSKKKVSDFLNIGDSIKFKGKSAEYEIYRSIENSEKIKPSPIIGEDCFKNFYSIEELKRITQKAFDHFLKRITTQKIKKSRIPLIVNLNDIDLEIIINFQKEAVFFEEKTTKNNFDEYVHMKTNSYVFGDMLTKKAHYDNLTISCILDWNRIIKNNLYPKELYDSLNFLHI